jgi:hypothetical protein
MSAAVNPMVGDALAIRPFSINVPESDLAERETVADFSPGVPLATVQKLARCWGTEYDWRKVEARLNAVPHFITEIDGLDITSSMGEPRWRPSTW